MKKTIFIIAVMAMSIDARESKILNYLGNYIPSLTEVGFALNCVNVYEKVSQFVRVTNRMISSVRQAKTDWEHTTENITKLYEDIHYLKDIDPYNMDSWQSGVDDFNFSIKYHQYMAFEAFGMLEQNTMFASANYVKSIITIDDYVKARNERRKAVSGIFNHSSYTAALQDNAPVIVAYKKQTIAQLRALQSADMELIRNAKTQEERDDVQAHYDLITREIANLETSASSSVQMMKPDSIINEAGNLIAINLTEIQCAQERIAEMQKASSNLAAAFYRLTGKTLNNQETGTALKLPDVPIDPTDYDAKNPDKVAAPAKPKDEAQASTADSRRDISNHDILNLQNAAACLALKQESLKRDIIAMKVNTMAYVVSLEAVKRNDVQKQVVLLGHQSKMMSILLAEQR